MQEIGLDPLTLFSRELERNWMRTRNGLRYAVGQRFAHRGQTPKDVVWTARKAELWHYRPLAERRFSTPILMHIGLVSRSYVLDLFPGNSFIEELLKAGFDVFVLDWGTPDEADADNDLATYVHELLPRAIKATLRTSGASQLNLISYCMGGCFALALLGTRAVPAVRSLVSIAAPVDFSQMGEFYDPVRGRDFEADRVLDETGNLPPNIVHGTVRVRRPTGELVQYANLWQNLWSEDFMEGFQAMREWVADHIPMPGRFFREIQRKWLVENGFMNGTLRVRGDLVDLSRISCPVMSILAEHDEMIPPPASAPLPGLLTGTSVHLERVRAGHVSLVCGRGMQRKTLPPLLKWLSEHSESAGSSSNKREVAHA